MSDTISSGPTFSSPEKGQRPDDNLDIHTPNKELPEDAERVASPIGGDCGFGSNPTTPRNDGGPSHSSVAQGGGEQSFGLNLEPLFEGEPGNNGILLPPLLLASVAPALGAEEEEEDGGAGANSSAGKGFKGTRVCCFRFDRWTRPSAAGTTPDHIKAHDANVLEDIRALMRRLESLVSGRSRAGIRIARPPTYFFDPAGGSGWLVLSAASTTQAKWEKVGMGLECDEVLPISHQQNSAPGTHGYDSVGKHFNLSKRDIDGMFMNILSDIVPPEVRESHAFSFPERSVY
jgi:hypothetical protein